MTDQNAKPTEEISVREVFGIDTDMKVKGFAERTDRVPAVDPTYKFDPDTTLAILAGFAYNRRVMPGFTSQEIEAERSKAYKRFYLRPSMIGNHLSRLTSLKDIKVFGKMVKQFVSWV